MKSLTRLLILIFTLIQINSFAQYQFTHYTTYNTGSNSLGANTIYLINENPVTHDLYFSCHDGLMKFHNNEYTPVISPLWFEWSGDIEFDIDMAGILWFGFNDSIYNYDGSIVNAIPIPTTSSNFNDILCDNQGNVWFARGNGVFKFDGNILTEYNTSTGLLSDNVSCLFEDSSGNIWVGSGMGINKFDGVSWTSYTASSGLIWSNNLSFGRTFGEDQSGKLWVGGLEIAYLTGDTWTVLDPAVLLNSSQAIINITTIECDSSGILWFGTSGYGLFNKNGNSWNSYTAVNGLGGDRVKNICIDSQNKIWVGIESGGLSILDNNIWTNINTSEGLTENMINDIYEDSNDNIWIANREGLNKLNSNTFNSYFATLYSDVGHVVNEDYSGNICTFGHNHFYRQTNNIWDTIYMYSTSFGWDFISDSIDDYWKVSSNGVTHFFDPLMGYYMNWTNYTVSEGLPSNWCECIERDSSGVMWVGTLNGIAYYNGSSFDVLPVPNEIFGNRIYDIRIDWDENIWFASDYGAAKYNGVDWDFYFEADGLANNRVYDFEIASDSTIWFATDGGISVLTDTGIYSIFKLDGLISNVVFCLEEDHEGNIWAGTLHGVSKIHDAIPDTINSISSRESYPEIKIFPNPARDKINIYSSLKIINLELYSITGTILKEINCNWTQQTIDISDLPTGTYFYRLKTPEFEISKKIIVIKE